MSSESHPLALFVACAIVVPAVLSVANPGCGGQWQDQPFVHEWPLVGHHEPLACEACHPAGAPIGDVARACEACHEVDRPVGHYVGQGCGDCHTAFDWGDLVGEVDHSFFPLEDAHALECVACHGPGGDYGGLSSACTSCHANKRPVGHFEGECSDCHVPTTWEEAAEVDHSLFPLVDAHAVGCIECHADGVFEGTDPACAACHEDDRPTPDHYRGEDCAYCHLATTWSEITFDHQQEFPIPHHDADTCIECHLSQPRYYQMSCLDGCHAQGETDAQHSGEQDYEYDSDRCYDCHADGQVP